MRDLHRQRSSKRMLRDKILRAVEELRSVRLRPADERRKLEPDLLQELRVLLIRRNGGIHRKR